MADRNEDGRNNARDSMLLYEWIRQEEQKAPPRRQVRQSRFHWTMISPAVYSYLLLNGTISANWFTVLLMLVCVGYVLYAYCNPDKI